jgi:hypothetical protein
MKIALAYLFNEYTPEDAKKLVQDGTALRSFRDSLQPLLRDSGPPEGEYGDNLVLGVVALRMKFPRDEAESKLDLNIAMRSRRG